MAKTRGYIFVLWADRFDESVATVLVTEFRRAGLRTKLVSLGSHASAGSLGLALAPDLTLDQALPLARRATCVVLPCSASGIRRLGADPRLRDFLSQASAQGAVFVVDSDGEGALGGVVGGGVAPGSVEAYAGRTSLFDCAGRVLRRLARSPSSGRSGRASLPASL